ncbi:MAG: LCP family protein, partial [Candidatus Kerfeldbacteria bacterium]|nr:LCP family protein [Candidatus Kerfeldbacteria bacterium]
MATPPPHLHPTESSLTIQPRVSPAATFPRRHHRLRWSLLSLSGIVIILLGLAGWIGYRAIAVVNTKKDGGQRVSFFQQLTHLVTASNQQLQGENDDRVNILLLGIGGPGHDGPYLTDTMIVASYKPSTRQLSLLSIPRDLVVNIPGYDYRKINNVLSFGRDIKYPGGGETLTTKVVSDLLGIPIQYYARVDFKGFAEVIDQVGGVNVTVDQAFTDSQYPTENYGYQTVWFKAGPQQMNGDLALKYSRSRHGNNGEGSDFARARRQQKVIFGLKERLLSFGTLVNPKKISDILGSLGSHSQTNMEVWEMARLAQLVSSIKSTD